MPQKNDAELRDWIREYYGKLLTKSSDLKTNACACSGKPPKHIAEALTEVHPAVVERFYGCGYPIPHVLDGMKAVDLGCGSGRDVYVLSRLVGPKGSVVGVDMTEEQLAVAEEYRGWHGERFGYDRPNTEFHRGYIEELTALPIEKGSVDLVVSNCVFNLSPRKDLVLQQVFELLKPGGELYFSDVFCDRRLPDDVANDPLLHAECLGGAMYLADFISMAKTCGFVDPRIMDSAPITINNSEIETKVGAASFTSHTFRLFKLGGLDDHCEDYGHMATYKGSIPSVGATYTLDRNHVFDVDSPERVCANTAAMLRDTRLGAHFEVTGQRKRHLGPFTACATLAAERHRAAAGTAAGKPGASCDAPGCC